jgi:hypothetical protein
MDRKQKDVSTIYETLMLPSELQLAQKSFGIQYHKWSGSDSWGIIRNNNSSNISFPIKPYHLDLVKFGFLELK